MRISLFPGKATPNLSYLTDTGSIWRGWQQYELNGVCPIKVAYKPEIQEIRITGSIPYLCRGHNYPAGAADLREGIDYIADVIGLNVFSGCIDELEFGKFVKVPLPVKVLLANHTALTGFRTDGHVNGYSRHFDSKALRVKLYDASRNFRHKVTGAAKQALREDFGFEPGKHYLKIENLYKKPEIYFKRKVLVADLFSPEFVDTCKTDLMETYQKIQKTPAGCNSKLRGPFSKGFGNERSLSTPVSNS